MELTRWGAMAIPRLKRAVMGTGEGCGCREECPSRREGFHKGMQTSRQGARGFSAPPYSPPIFTAPLCVSQYLNAPQKPEGKGVYESQSMKFSFLGSEKVECFQRGKVAIFSTYLQITERDKG